MKKAKVDAGWRVGVLWVVIHLAAVHVGKTLLVLGPVMWNLIHDHRYQTDVTLRIRDCVLRGRYTSHRGRRQCSRIGPEST